MRTNPYSARRRTTFEYSDPAGTRVVVASMGEARLYDIGPGSVVTGAGRMIDVQARLHDRDLSSDRPGRVFDRAPPAGRRGAGAHHSTDGERSPHRHRTLMFARRIAAALERDRQLGRFSTVVIVAAPTFLGLLRSVMHGPLRKMIAGQVHKDLANLPERNLKAQVHRLLAQVER